jgi:RNA-directed DNA polymerase
MEMDRRNPAPPVNSRSAARNDPLRRRRYLHLDERPPRKYLESLVTNPAEVADWQFLPLIRHERVWKRIKRKGGKREIKEKSRPICYAGHHDAALYAYYASRLTDSYEKLLATYGLSDCVTAFRTACGKCNIHYASEAFQWISSHRPCVALAYDVSKFFDSLNHGILKQKWCEVLGTQSLPSDAFAIYRSLTRFAVVERDLLYKEFAVSRHKPHANGRKRICASQAFRRKIVDQGKLVLNKKPFGIPQGTPISAVLSNIYMLGFDRTVAARVAEWGGLYRRYCDDILCVVPPQYSEEAKRLIEVEIDKVKLDVQPEKLDDRAFPEGAAAERPLQYLGLTFDGDRVLLRSHGFGKYYARMRSAVRGSDASRRRIARESGKDHKTMPIRRRKLYDRHSYVGKRNFVAYAQRAAAVTKDPAIKRQVSRHWMMLKQMIDLMEQAD